MEMIPFGLTIGPIRWAYFLIFLNLSDKIKKGGGFQDNIFPNSLHHGALFAAY